jgi:arylsulfatase A-like enzyme
VQHVDLFPTILELLGLEREVVSNQLLGRSLRPEAARTNPRPFTISERLAPSLRRFHRDFPHFDTTPLERQLRALRSRDSGYKLIWGSDKRHELYDLARDPGETKNLAALEPEKARKLQEQLEKWLASIDAAGLGPLQPELDELVAERLRDLGYL